MAGVAEVDEDHDVMSSVEVASRKPRIKLHEFITMESECHSYCHGLLSVSLVLLFETVSVGAAEADGPVRQETF